MDSQRVSALNFATSPDTDGFTMPHKRPRTARDPMSHRIIEKRRRDRMNNCLADLSHLIPASYLKQGQGRIEKTEIIEMAIKHIKHLQMLHLNRSKETKQDMQGLFVTEGDSGADKFYMGFRECMDEMMRFLVEKQGFSASDPICMQIIRHLQEHSQQFLPPGGINSMTKSSTPTETVTRASVESKDSQGTDVKEQSKAQHMFSSTEDENSQLDAAVADSVYHRINRNILDLQSCTSDITDHSFMEEETASKADSGIASNMSSISMNASDYLSKSGSEDNYRHGMSEAALTEQQQRDQHIYKFKNDIKSRFQSDVNSVGAEERDSVSDLWLDEEKEEKKQVRPASPSQASSANSSTPYPNSDNSSSNGNGQCHSSTTRRGTTCGIAPTHVPGFALHSSGTYYVPVVIHTSSYTMVFRADQQNSQGMGILHPISIPVSFGGPIVPARNGVRTNPPSSRSPNNSNSSNGSNGMESPPKKPKVT